MIHKIIHKVIHRIIHKNGHTCCTLNKLKETKQNKTKIEKEKNKKKNETEFDQLINQNFSDEELKSTIYEFIKMRKAIKKPLTIVGLSISSTINCVIRP